MQLILRDSQELLVIKPVKNVSPLVRRRIKKLYGLVRIKCLNPIIKNMAKSAGEGQRITSNWATANIFPDGTSISKVLFAKSV